MDSLHQFCKHLPKIELHAHLNGSIREHTLLELANERNVKLPRKFLLHEAEHHDPDKEVLFFNTKPRSLEECFDIFAIIPQCVNDLVALRRITKEVLMDAAHDNISYIELRTGPKLLLRDHRSGETNRCTKKEYIETIIGIMQEFERCEQQRYKDEKTKSEKVGEGEFVRLPLIPRLIISVDRSGTLDQAMGNIDLAIDMFQSPYIVGVELGGNPMRNDFRLFEPAFEKARAAGLPIAIHCGEVPTGSSELEEDEALLKAYEEALSIIHFRPDRLGHALLLSNPLMELLSGQHIPIECCPTSNIMTLELALHNGGNIMDGMKRHPQLAKWIAESYPISINTDDSGLFCTNLTKELILVATANGLCNADIGNIVLNSVDHIFDTKGNTHLKLRAGIQHVIDKIHSK